MLSVGANLNSSKIALRPEPSKKSQSLYPWIVWGIAASLFFVEYFARISPSVMLPYLMRDFNADGYAIGTLSAFFYYPYVVMQVPVGMLFDKYGVRRLLLVTAVLCGISCFLFAYASSLGLAELSRFLLGFSASFAFVGALKLAINWFPNNKIGLLAGMTQALGMLGAAVGDAPMSIVIHHLGWRDTVKIFGEIFIVLAVLVFIFVYNSPVHKNKQSFYSDLSAPSVTDEQATETLEIHSEQTKVSAKASSEDTLLTMLAGLREVLANLQTWINGVYVGALYCSMAAFAELWGVDYLQNAYQLSHTQAAAGIGIIFIGWAIGGPIVGRISDQMGKRRPLMFLSALCGFILLSTILYVPAMPIWMLFTLLFLFGMTNTGVGLAYALSSEINSRQVSATSMAFANMASVIVGTILQPIIGRMLDLGWGGKMQNGVRVFSEHNYRVALFVLPVCMLVAMVSVFFLKETYCRPVKNS